jgi:hypothetical protein
MSPRHIQLTHAPYAQDGSLLRKPDGAFEWRPNEPFRQVLTLQKGGSPAPSTYVEWQDRWGRRYPMFTSSLVDLLIHSTVSSGSTVGWWIVTKRNNTYGICRLTVDP